MHAVKMSGGIIITECHSMRVIIIAAQAVAETQETDVRFITWLILANQHVNYTHNTIYIFNVYGDEVQR